MISICVWRFQIVHCTYGILVKHSPRHVCAWADLSESHEMHPDPIRDRSVTMENLFSCEVIKNWIWECLYIALLTQNSIRTLPIFYLVGLISRSLNLPKHVRSTVAHDCHISGGGWLRARSVSSVHDIVAISKAWGFILKHNRRTIIYTELMKEVSLNTNRVSPYIHWCEKLRALVTNLMPHANSPRSLALNTCFKYALVRN